MRFLTFISIVFLLMFCGCSKTDSEEQALKEKCKKICSTFCISHGYSVTSRMAFGVRVHYTCHCYYDGKPPISIPLESSYLNGVKVFDYERLGL